MSQLGRSRWLVGSSSTSRFTGFTMIRARARRVRSPPDRSPTVRSTASPRNPKPPSTERRLRPWSSPTAERSSSNTVRSNRSDSTWCWANSATSTLAPISTSPRHRLELAEEHPQQRRLARAVRTDQRQLLTTLDDQVDVGQDRRRRRSRPSRPRPRRRPATTAAARGTRSGPRAPCGRAASMSLELLQRLDAALHLAGLGRLVAEPLDEPFGLGDLRLLGGGGRLGRREALLALDDELGEPADVLDGPAVRDLDDPLGDRVDEVAVVADEQDGAGPRRRCCSSHATDSTSRWLVGSSSTSRSGAESIRRASATRMRHPPDRSCDGPVAVARREPEARQDALCLGLDPVAAERLEPVLRLAVRLERRVVGSGSGSVPLDAGLGHLDREPVELLLQVDHVGGAPQDLVDDGAVGPARSAPGAGTRCGCPCRRAPRPRRPAGCPR